MVNEYHKKPKLLTCFHNHVRKSNAVISCEKLENYFSIEKKPVKILFSFLKKNAFAIVKSSVSNIFFHFSINMYYVQLFFDNGKIILLSTFCVVSSNQCSAQLG